MRIPGAALLVGLLTLLVVPAQSPAQTTGKSTLTPQEAMKILSQRGDWERLRLLTLLDLWDDIHKPDILQTLRYLVTALDQLKDTEQAAAFCHILLRELDEATPPLTAQQQDWQNWARITLKRLDVDFIKKQKEYAAGAEGKKFTTPEAVSDLWITQVDVSLRPLHGLYAWKLIGGRSDVPKDWIHNTQGKIDRSGGKWMDEVQGRKGVLFCLCSKKSKRQSLLRWQGPIKGDTLRIGTMGYHFPYILNVLVDDKEVFTQNIAKDQWQDLKIPLKSTLGKDSRLSLELVVPEDQKPTEGLFFDYVDFFTEPPASTTTAP